MTELQKQQAIYNKLLEALQESQNITQLLKKQIYITKKKIEELQK